MKKILTVLIFITLVFSGICAAIKDSESASHADTAAVYTVVNTYNFDGYKLVQFNLAVLSHYSYMVISDGKILLVDPGRDIQAYIDYAKKEGLTFAGVYLTHSHADFIAGHMEMVKAAGCPIYQSDKAKAKYKYEPIHEGSTIEVGQAVVKFMDTPGHVVDGTSAVVYGKGKDIADIMLSGDYLFVGSVGRPDLVTGTTSAALAGLAYDTWVNKVSKLGDSVKVFPSHGAGSLCGANLKDSPFTTIGEEKASNPYFQYKGRSEFIMAVISDLTEPPQYFGHNAAMNRDGPELIAWNSLTANELAAGAELTDTSKYYVVDIRDSKNYAAGHIPNSVNIAIRGRMETWIGIMVPWGANLVLCGDEQDIKEALYRINRVGYKANVIKFESWQNAGLPILSNIMIEPAELYKQMQEGKEPIIVDVRLPNEWMGLRIGTVLNLPLNHLAELSGKLEPSEPVVTVCNSAYRSVMAIGILERKGFTKITSMAGGSEAWINAGLPVFGSQTKTTASVPKRVIPLPERLSTSELKRLMLDLPGTFEMVDIRPAEQFKDYSLPGAANVDIADLINNPAYLVGAGPLIIIDRDGSLAMAAAGILSQKTNRQIKSLYGGLQAYWAESQFEKVEPKNSITPEVPQNLLSAPMQQKMEEQKPQVPKKKSAGC